MWLVISLRCEAKPAFHIRERAFQWQINELLYSIVKLYMLIGEDSENEILISFHTWVFYIKGLYFDF